ncbi:MAG TPA: type VI secretion system-associated protein TagF [Polyangia bacterium]|nr:type VI secretion system-associated protein TagF [Polyangia bacterium]
MSGGDQTGAGVGVYGKVSSQPDFFRLGAGAFSQAGLDRWLQEGVEVLRAERSQLPAAPTAFLLAPSGAATLFTGVLVPSADAAGRSFPLALFTEVPPAAARDTLPSLPTAAAPFVAGASAALGGVPPDGDELTRRVQGMNQTMPGGLTPLPEPHAWKNEPVGALVGMLGSPAALAYALRTLVAACERAAGAAATAGNALTVQAPIFGPAQSALWLEVARRRLGATIPSLLWTAEGEGNLLVTLGPPAPLALAFVANPRHRSTRLWPLRTAVASAADQAWAALEPSQRQAIEEPYGTLGDLAASFG